MTLPFTPEQFYEVFGRYNETVWPAQIALTGLALAGIGFALPSPRWSDRATSFILAVLWAWMGMAYH